MKIDRERKRLKAIKLKYVLFPAKCDCCGEEYTREKMWQFYRYEANKLSYKHYYCQNCMHSAEEVLHEIDTDESSFGLAGIDDFILEKRDYTRMHLKTEKMVEFMCGQKVLPQSTK